MAIAPAAYEPRYLAGVLLFNRHDYFEAHEVWESLWLDGNIGADRRFVQGLIQAAVALYHFGNGNLRGARKLFLSGRNYMAAYPSPHLGLDAGKFWRDMENCFARLLAAPEPAEAIPLDPALRPQLELEPAPGAWPDPTIYLDEDD